MKDCWHQEPSLRPTGFPLVVERLAGLVANMGDPRENMQQGWHQEPSLNHKGSRLGGEREVASTPRARASPENSGDTNVTPSAPPSDEMVPWKVPSHLVFSCPGRHGLQEHEVVNSTDICHSGGNKCRHRRFLPGNTMLRCNQCNFNTCVACVASHLQLMEKARDGDLCFNCPEHHGLKEHKSKSKTHDCNRCSRRLAIGSMWLRCHTCDFDACVGCVTQHLISLGLSG